MAERVAFAGAEWAARLTDAYAGLPALAGATAVVDHTGTGGPDGEVAYWTAFEDGRLVAAGAGHHADPTVTMTSPYTLASRVATGAADPSVAFMQGRTKVVGPMGPVMALLPLTQSDEYLSALADVAVVTDF